MLLEWEIVRKFGVHLIEWYPAKVQATHLRLSRVTFFMAILSRGSAGVSGLIREIILNSHGHVA